MAWEEPLFELPGEEETQVVPFDINTFPELPGATVCRALVPLPRSTWLLASVFDPVPPCPTVTGEAEVRMVALELGKVNVFSEEDGPENFVNPFPVPPKLEEIIWLRLVRPSKELP